PDLDGNIHPASRGVADATFAGAADSDGADGHGTLVSGVIAAERNGAGGHGVAFGARILAVNATSPGSCASDCEFAQSDLAAGLDHARLAGARVVNFSLGGGAMGGPLAAAVQRAVAADMVIVIAAGNDGD